MLNGLDFREGFYWHSQEGAPTRLCFVSLLKGCHPKRYHIDYFGGSDVFLTPELAKQMMGAGELDVNAVIRERKTNLAELEKKAEEYYHAQGSAKLSENDKSYLRDLDWRKRHPRGPHTPETSRSHARVNVASLPQNVKDKLNIKS